MAPAKKNKLVKVESSELVNTPSEAEVLISQAIAKNVPVETMEKLLAMRRELKAEKARELFFEALSQLQNDMPVVTKNKIVYNKDGKSIRYKYAPIDDIIRQTKEAIKNNGFSYMIETSTDNAQLNVVCKVTHEAGHMESSSFVVPIDKSAFMNAQQQFAAASTYAKRYAFCNAFGILTGDEDDDSNSVETVKAPDNPPAAARPANRPTNTPTGNSGKCPICFATGNFHSPKCSNYVKPEPKAATPAVTPPTSNAVLTDEQMNEIDNPKPKFRTLPENTKMSDGIQRARILALAHASGIERNDFVKMLLEKYNIEKSVDLTWEEAEQTIKDLTPMVAEEDSV